MVTMPSEAAELPDLVRDLVAAGMDVMRINCAHDDAAAWRRMVGQPPRGRARSRAGRAGCCATSPDRSSAPGPSSPARAFSIGGRCATTRAASSSPRACRIVADRAASDAGRRRPARRARAPRSSSGRATSFASPTSAAAAVCSPSPRSRTTAAVGEADRNTYVASHAPLVLHRAGAAVAVGRVGVLRPVEQVLRLDLGDTLVLTAESELGRPAERDDAGRVVASGEHRLHAARGLQRRPARGPDLLRRREDRRRRARSGRTISPGGNHASPRRQGQAPRGPRHQPARHGLPPVGPDGEGPRRPRLRDRARGHRRPLVPALARRRGGAPRRAGPPRRPGARDRAQDRDAARASISSRGSCCRRSAAPWRA